MFEISECVISLSTRLIFSPTYSEEPGQCADDGRAFSEAGLTSTDLLGDATRMDISRQYLSDVYISQHARRRTGRLC